MKEEQYSSDELYHYGRLGMKWGQHIFGDIKKVALEYHKRRIKEKNIKENTRLQIRKLKKQAKEEAKRRKFQNKQADKIKNAKQHILNKYGIDYGKDNVPNKEKSSTKSNQLTKKQIKNLSDSELKERQNRLNNEKQLIELQNYHASMGQKFVRTVMKDVLVPAAISAGKDLTTSYLKKYGEIGIDAFGDSLRKKKKEKEE